MLSVRRSHAFTSIYFGDVDRFEIYYLYSECPGRCQVCPARPDPALAPKPKPEFLFSSCGRFNETPSTCKNLTIVCRHQSLDSICGFEPWLVWARFASIMVDMMGSCFERFCQKHRNFFWLCLRLVKIAATFGQCPGRYQNVLLKHCGNALWAPFSVSKRI